jgi:hypothetical protein
MLAMKNGSVMAECHVALYYYDEPEDSEWEKMPMKGNDLDS